MTVSFRRIIESLQDIAASQQMAVHLQVIVQGHRHLLYQGLGTHSPNPLNCWIDKWLESTHCTHIATDVATEVVLAAIAEVLYPGEVAKVLRRRPVVAVGK